MGLIVFIHGMGDDPRRDYWRDWARALQEALAAREVKVGADDFAGIYYYDLVPGPVKTKAYSAPRAAWQENLRSRVLAEISADGDFAGKSRFSLAALADLVVNNFGDIYTYLYVEQIHQAVNWRVYELLHGTDRPVHLLGYSLGSLVAYCALQKSPPLAGRVAHLLTLGSPLFWFRDGVERRVDLQVRPAVGYWTNLAGIIDIAWPHAVPRLVRGLDEHREFIVDRFNPVHGHLAYFNHPESLRVMAGVLKEKWL